MTSILTNIAAMSALQTLRSINSGLEETQARVSSGMRVATASDNAAYWSIATTMRSDNLALSAVQDALGLGAAKVDTAYAGMESAIDVVKEIKAKLVAATEEGVDKAKVQEEISQLQDQLKSIASSASFSGENWLEANLGGSKESLAMSVVGSFVRTDDSVSVKRINHQLSSSTVLFDTNATAGAQKYGILDATLKLDEKRAEVEITTAKPVTATGEQLAQGGGALKQLDLDGTAKLDYYVTDGGETYIRHNTEKFDANGGPLGFSPALDANGKELWVKVKWSADPVAPATPPAAPNDQTAKPINSSTPIATATTGGFAADFGMTAAADGKFYIQTEPVVTKVSVAATTEAALAELGTDFVPTTAANFTATTGVYASMTGAEKATVSADGFTKIVTDPANLGVKTIYSDYKESTITPGTFNPGKTETYVKLGADDTWVKVLAGGNGAVATTDAGKAKAAGQQAVTVNGNEYYIDSKNSTAPGKVETDVGVSVSDLDITELGDLSTKLGYTEKEVLDKLIQYVDDQLKTATSAAADLGSIKMRIDMQEDFVSKLTDSIESGIGRLVDAEMNEESTRLKALQTQQQLAVQALSIANSSSESILSLFR